MKRKTQDPSVQINACILLQNVPIAAKKAKIIAMELKMKTTKKSY